jgi:hypothetical protein
MPGTSKRKRDGATALSAVKTKETVDAADARRAAAAKSEKASGRARRFGW